MNSLLDASWNTACPTNAYYPDSDRGTRLVVRSTLIGMGGRMINGVVQEFLLRKFTVRRAERNGISLRNTSREHAYYRHDPLETDRLP